MYRLLFLSLCLGWAIAGTAQSATNRTVNARADLARKEITIGDQIILSINISAPPGTTVYPIDPAVIDELPAAEVIDAKDLNTVAEDPELLLEQRFLITSFDTGYVTIPALPVYFEDASGRSDTAYTNDLLLTVKGALVAAEDDIMPIKPIIEEPRNWTDYWWLYLALVAVVAFFGYRQYRQKRQAPAPAAPPPLPPDVLAQQELDALEAKRLWQSGQTKAYYSELTHILRNYLEGRFGIPALEMTTRQITTELARRDELSRSGRGELSELLQLSDLVKFAKATPAEELHQQGMLRVRNFVSTTAKFEEE